MMKLQYTIAAMVVTTLASNAAITMTKATADFTNNYDGNEIHDGTTYLNNWSENAAALVNESVSGSVLTITNSGVANGWIQQTAGDFLSIGSTAGWTLEATLTLDGTDGLVLWADGSNGGNGALVYVGANGIGTNGNGTGSNQSLSSVSNVGTHTFRIAYDTSTATINVWRNGVLVSDTVAATNPGGGPRLIIGDCCSNATTGVLFDSIDIHNISYDTTGGFAPVPEPSSTALLGLGGLALILRRRK